MSFIYRFLLLNVYAWELWGGQYLSAVETPRWRNTWRLRARQYFTQPVKPTTFKDLHPGHKSPNSEISLVVLLWARLFQVALIRLRLGWFCIPFIQEPAGNHHHWCHPQWHFCFKDCTLLSKRELFSWTKGTTATATRKQPRLRAIHLRRASPPHPQRVGSAATCLVVQGGLNRLGARRGAEAQAQGRRASGQGKGGGEVSVKGADGIDGAGAGGLGRRPSSIHKSAACRVMRYAC